MMMKKKKCCEKVKELARCYEGVWRMNREEYLKLASITETNGEKYPAMFYRELAVIYGLGATEFGLVAKEAEKSMEKHCCDELESRVKTLAEMYARLAVLYEQDALMMQRSGFKEEGEKYADLANRSRIFSEQLRLVILGKE